MRRDGGSALRPGSVIGSDDYVEPCRIVAGVPGQVNIVAGTPGGAGVLRRLWDATMSRSQARSAQV